MNSEMTNGRETTPLWRGAVEEDGFAMIPGVLESVEVLKLLRELNDAPLRRSRAGARNALTFAPVAGLARDPRLLGIVRGILGSAAIPFRATLFDKSPTANWLVPWHQDTALPLRERRDAPDWGPWSVKGGVLHARAPSRALCKVLALRFHLDDSTSRNGPLRVLPGTHAHGVLSDEEIHDFAARTPAVECIVSQGGVLVMRPLLIHASSKSRENLPRRVLHFEYAAPSVVDEGLELAVA
ncbi:MAG: phytanoyl-CoA dioxygenase family protein [Acidobacteria bacterium]|nr:phytanoyl-CoA dioxygenase family protein [Acidobacteriota bacterium]